MRTAVERVGVGVSVLRGFNAEPRLSNALERVGLSGWAGPAPEGPSWLGYGAPALAPAALLGCEYSLCKCKDRKEEEKITKTKRKPCRRPG